MSFRKLPGNKGMIYIPDRRSSTGKRSCRDCFSCNWCSDDRCLICRPECSLKKNPCSKSDKRLICGEGE